MTRYEIGVATRFSTQALALGGITSVISYFCVVFLILTPFSLSIQVLVKGTPVLSSLVDYDLDQNRLLSAAQEGPTTTESGTTHHQLRIRIRPRDRERSDREHRTRDVPALAYEIVDDGDTAIHASINVQSNIFDRASNVMMPETRTQNLSAEARQIDQQPTQSPTEFPSVVLFVGQTTVMEDPKDAIPPAPSLSLEPSSLPRTNPSPSPPSSAPSPMPSFTEEFGGETPVMSPTESGGESPAMFPVSEPTVGPSTLQVPSSIAPSASLMPIVFPTSAPTMDPTYTPTALPTQSPTASPTITPYPSITREEG